MKKIIFIMVCITLFITGCSEKQSKVESKVKYVWKQAMHIKDYNFNDIIKYEENFFLGTDKGIFTFDPVEKKIKENEYMKKLSGRKVFSFIEFNGSILIGTDRGIARYTGNLMVKSIGKIFNILKYSENEFLAGTPEGLYRISSSLNDYTLLNGENSFFKAYRENQDLSDRLLNVNSLLKSENKIFIGSDEGLIVVSDKFDKEKFYYGDYVIPSFASNEFINKNGNSPLSGNIIKVLNNYEDEIWIGCNKGINIFDHKKDSWKTFTAGRNEKVLKNGRWEDIYVDGNSALSGNYVNSIERFNNFFVIGTNKGVDLYNLDVKKFEKKIFESRVRCVRIIENKLYISTDFDGIYVYEYVEEKSV